MAIHDNQRTASTTPEAPLAATDPNRPQGPGYDTLAAPGSAELKVQRSRFLAEVRHAPDEASARAALEDMARLHHDARHHCFAWRLGRGDELVEHRSDDGEPSGSAGEPILNALRRADVHDVVAVAARWFGGVKLGTGGLGRAYRDAAAEALEAAPRRRIRLGETVEVRFPYPLQKTVSHFLDAHGGERVDEAWGEDALWTLWFPADTVEAFVGAVEDAGQGRLAVVRLGPETR